MLTGESIWSVNASTPSKEDIKECIPMMTSPQDPSILPDFTTGKSPPSTPSDTDISPSAKDGYVILKDDKSDKPKGNFEDLLYFVCNLCPFLCTKNDKITEHLENAHKNKTIIKLPRFKCPACPNIFFHRISLRSHLIHDHGVGNADLGEIIQAVIYYAHNNTKKSQKIKEEEKEKAVNLPKLDITQNETIFNTMLNEQHTTPKSGETRCALPSCKVKLNDPENMSYHIRSHHEAGFKCIECGDQFAAWKALVGHLWRTHRLDMELYACDQCDFRTYNLSKLNNIHKLIHGDVKAFACTLCKKAFKNRKQLNNHKMSHRKQANKTMYECEICCKQCSDKRQLKIHVDVVHNKIKPFLCSYCGYKGSSRSSLKMHIRQHTGEKPFACDSCSYTTSDHNSLRRHKLRHTGQKPYKCTYCSYACIQSSTYKVHLKTKHPGLENELMFTCQECQFRTVKKDIYVAHRITVHDQKPE